MSKFPSSEPAESDAVAFRSLRFGWWAVAVSLSLGLLLEAPHGFLLGGIVIHDGDPGLSVLLVPLGGFLLA